MKVYCKSLLVLAITSASAMAAQGTVANEEAGLEAAVRLQVVGLADLSCLEM